MKIDETGIKMGGMMRCCIKTIMDTPLGTQVQPGEKLKCNWCKGGVVLNGSRMWEWDESLGG